MAKSRALCNRRRDRRIAGLEIYPERLADKFGTGTAFFFAHFLKLADERRREGDSHGFGGSHILRAYLGSY